MKSKSLKIFLFVILLFSIFQKSNSQTTEVGLTSYYNDKFDGRPTASGMTYDKTKMTAAHRTLPFNTKIKVTNLINNKSIVVIVNDRGPFIKGRILDLSKAAAIKLDFINEGVAKVMLEVLEYD
ncbi:MAG: septal ring lytic transglycosylase RlpA family protein [Bacteroidota bacterium]